MLRRTDVIMKDLWLRLSEDAIAATNGRIIVNPIRKTCLLENDVKSFREWHYANNLDTIDPYLLKWRIQLDTLFKRYKFAKDSFSEEELALRASAKFLSDQQRVSTPLQLSTKTMYVLRTARKIVKEILADYTEEEHAALCKLSSHANRGIPFHQAFLDVKVRRLTGSVDHIKWFKKCVTQDALLKHAVHEQGRPAYPVCDSLRLAKVPKSWKAVRTMMPHTVCGSFYTNGLGNMYRQRLLDAGLDISRLQQRHKMLARKFSVTRTHVTADLSSASDSFNRELLCRLLPRRWYRATVFGNPRYCEDNGIRVSLQSVMTMGMGHTFPLQTLLFYSLLRAVKTLLGVNGVISVYGDDLIYPRSMHKYVVPVFKELNFRINTDKTFVTSHFRESCGGDYYRGFDMRPFSPEDHARDLSRKTALEFYYSLYNGLRLRWEPEEIPRTLHYLLQQIVTVSGVIHQVPPSYPATAGIQVDIPLQPGILPWARVKRDRNGCDLKHFDYLRRVAKNRDVKSECIHLWHLLQSKQDDQADCIYASGRPVLRFVKKRVGRQVLLIPVENDKCTFQVLQQTGQDSWSKRPFD